MTKYFDIVVSRGELDVTESTEQQYLAECADEIAVKVDGVNVFAYATSEETARYRVEADWTVDQMYEKYDQVEHLMGG